MIYEIIICKTENRLGISFMFLFYYDILKKKNTYNIMYIFAEITLKKYIFFFLKADTRDGYDMSTRCRYTSLHS